MTDPVPTRLILVRHAETDWNAEGRIQGRTDTSLSARGRRQAGALATNVANWEPLEAVTSPSRRAWETAELLGFPDATADPRWQEADFGHWTGRLRGELQMPGDSLVSWREGRVTPPGGEPFAVLTNRVVEAASNLLDAQAGTWLVVTHGGSILALCCALLEIAPAALIPVGSASVTVLERSDRVRLRIYNQPPPQS